MFTTSQLRGTYNDLRLFWLCLSPNFHILSLNLHCTFSKVQEKYIMDDRTSVSFRDTCHFQVLFACHKPDISFCILLVQYYQLTYSWNLVLRAKDGHMQVDVLTNIRTKDLSTFDDLTNIIKKILKKFVCFFKAIVFLFWNKKHIHCQKLIHSRKNFHSSNFLVVVFE